MLDDYNSNITVCSHPLIKALVSEIRDKTTAGKRFRRLVKELARHIVYESLGDIPLKEVEFETPLAKTRGFTFMYEQFILAPILRAGLAMIDGALETLPGAEIRHIGLYRDENTLEPVEYYIKLPESIPEDTYVLLMDPMLATGGSATIAVDIFKKRGAKKIKFLCIIASVQGIKALSTAHPDIQIYTSAIDPILNENGYIVPGLGDAGDRSFGT